MYEDEDVVDALSYPDSVYALDFGTLVTSPHYEFKLGHGTEDELVAYYRRPRRYARDLLTFPWEPDSLLVLFTRNSRHPAIFATLRSYAEQADGRSATGSAVLEVHETRPLVAGVAHDLARAIHGNAGHSW